MRSKYLEQAVIIVLAVSMCVIPIFYFAQFLILHVILDLPLYDKVLFEILHYVDLSLVAKWQYHVQSALVLLALRSWSSFLTSGQCTILAHGCYGHDLGSGAI
jgi:hypothetical protein